jgi:hydroxymethylbilane synthase
MTAVRALAGRHQGQPAGPCPGQIWWWPASPVVDVEIVPVRTEGYRTDAPLAQIGGTGVFVSALRDALLDGRIDVAVHSFKDLPVAPAAGIELAAVPAREDVRDAHGGRDGLTLHQLPSGRGWGTGSTAAGRPAAGLGARPEGRTDPRKRRLAVSLVAQGQLDAWCWR